MKTAREFIGKLDSERCDEQGHPLVMAVCMCYVRRENLVEREKELKAPGLCGHPKACWQSFRVIENGIDIGEQWGCVSCAETAKLQAEIAELRAGAAAVLERLSSTVDCVFHGSAPKSDCDICRRDNVWRETIRAAIPADSAAALEDVKRKARLEEIENIVQKGFHADTELDAYMDKRLSQLRAEAGEKVSETKDSAQ